MTKKSKRGAGVFLGFDCEMSMKSRKRIIGEWKQLNFQQESTCNLQDLAKMLNEKSRGIINYFGKINALP